MSARSRSGAAGIAPSVSKPFAIIVVMLAVTLILPTGFVRAAAGDLDSTFGVGGKVLTDFGAFTDSALSVCVKQSGKIVAAGYTGDSIDFALAQYNRDGSLDTSFGSGGKVITDFFGGTDVAKAVLAQPDGKVIAVGTALQVFNYAFALARYNSDGSLDSSFGYNGKVTTELTGGGQARAAVLCADGKIIAAGYSFSNGIGDAVLARYNSDGSLDTTFGSGGVVTTDIMGLGGAPSAIALQHDNRIVIAGLAVGRNGGVALVRFNGNGSLDSTYGTAGLVTTRFLGFNDFATGLAIQQDGKAVVAGYALIMAGSSHIALARFNADGSLDLTFGSGGKVVNTGATSETAEAVAVQHDGKIVVVGSRLGFAVVRYNSNGVLDSNFGIGGIANTSFGGITGSAKGLALQSDHKIVAVGTASNDGQGEFALARYDGKSVSFDICLQDDSTSNLLQWNSLTGDYQLTNCRGFTLDGLGVVTERGSLLTLQQNGPDRRLLARFDADRKQGTAEITLYSQPTTFTIVDRNTANDTCACTAH